MSYHTESAFLKRMEQRRSSPQIPFPFQSFYHIACMGNWKEVLLEQLEVIKEKKLEPICFVIGSPSDIDWVRQLPLRVAGTSSNLLLYETPTLELLYEWCEENTNGAVLYFHTKGVSKPSCKIKPLWRKLMSKHVVERWSDNLQLLCDYDIVGVNWMHDPRWPHYSGNFWMARSDWIYQLPNPALYRMQGGPDLCGNPWDRMSAEMWLGCRPYHHARSLCCENTVMWEDEKVFHLLNQ